MEVVARRKRVCGRVKIKLVEATVSKSIALLMREVLKKKMLIKQDKGAPFPSLLGRARVGRCEIFDHGMGAAVEAVEKKTHERHLRN